MIQIGIDLGGTNIVAGVVNDRYEILATAKCKTNVPRPAQAIIDDMIRVAQEAVEKAGLTMDDIDGIGIGSPGSVNPIDGILDGASNLQIRDVHFKEIFEERLGKPTHLENDANAAAYGEVIAGAAKGAKHAACITIGTGVGGGVIIDGKLLYGRNYAAAELGHLVINIDGLPCPCGRHGCLEQYASATALVRQTKAAMEQDKNSVMWRISDGGTNVNGLTAFDAMREGDETARQVVMQFAKYLAVGIINVIRFSEPEVVCVGGGVSHEGETLLSLVREFVYEGRKNEPNENSARIVAATLGNDAGIIGAAFAGV